MKLVDVSATADNAEVMNASEMSEMADMNSAMTFSGQAYHELAEKTVQDIDPLQQLQNNIELLSDLQGRLAFVMREVKYLSKI